MRTITISGNVGKDPVVNNTQSGTRVANFNVAVRQNRPDTNGDYGTDWFRCSVWGNRASTIEKFYRKGSHVVLTGDLELNEYNGQTQLGVNVRDFDLPERNNGNTGQSQPAQLPARPTGSDDIDINDDDLPF